MDFFFDENMPLSAMEAVEELGYDCEHVRTVDMHGAADPEVAAYAVEHDAVLVTKDLAFGSTLLYPAGSHHGLLVVRLPHDFSPRKQAEYVEDFLQDRDLSELVGIITVLELDRYRTRPLPATA